MLGEDNQRVYSDGLGLTATEIARLKADRVILAVVCFDH